MSKRDLRFDDEGWGDYVYWQKTDKKLLKKLNALLEEIRRTPFEGAGKPEALRGNLTGYWSRRLDQKNRLVYKVTNDVVIIIACRYHYDDK